MASHGFPGEKGSLSSAGQTTCQPRPGQSSSARLSVAQTPAVRSTGGCESDTRLAPDPSVVSGQRVKLDMANGKDARTRPAWRYFNKYSVPTRDGNNECCNARGDGGGEPCDQEETKHAAKDGASAVMKRLRRAHPRMAKEVLGASRHCQGDKIQKYKEKKNMAPHLLVDKIVAICVLIRNPPVP